jgi:hypothetical protein
VVQLVTLSAGGRGEGGGGQEAALIMLQCSQGEIPF